MSAKPSFEECAPLTNAAATPTACAPPGGSMRCLRGEPRPPARCAGHRAAERPSLLQENNFSCSDGAVGRLNVPLCGSGNGW
jgi:hypothetical protein